jgi:ribosomal protein L3 glutamine methyltransferase
VDQSTATITKLTYPTNACAFRVGSGFVRVSTAPTTAREHVLAAEQRFIEVGLVFGHGTDNARDEAVFLVFHALFLPFDVADSVLDSVLDEAQNTAIGATIDERISSRRPAAYLTGYMWFAGHKFQVDERVLIPRSPIAELINNKFSPWLDASRIHRVLEIGTGSGCIAIATAMALPEVTVAATDISPDALTVAVLNRADFPNISERVSFVQADLFPSSNDRYDLIISNPPYVPSKIVSALPPEYAHEPVLGLDAGTDGLNLIRRIVAKASERLHDHGALILDVGEMADTVDREIRSVHFTWIELEHGGAGVGIAQKADFDL